MTDTINLLRECDSGIKTGIDTIDEVLSHIKNDKFVEKLSNYKNDYNKLLEEIESCLGDYGYEGKEPDTLAKGMATLKTNVKLALNDSDSAIADIITNGCDMGVKTLNKYLNEYDGAGDEAKEYAEKLIRLMDRQNVDMREYL